MSNSQPLLDDGANGPTGSQVHLLQASGESDAEDSHDDKSLYKGRIVPSPSKSSHSEREDHARTSHPRHRNSRREKSSSRSPMVRKGNFCKHNLKHGPSRKFKRKYMIGTNQYDVDEVMRHALCTSSPRPAPVQGRPRVLLVHSPPLNRHEEPIMKAMEQIEKRLNLVHRKVVEPFRTKYSPKPHEEQYTGRILEMLRSQGLDKRFGCDKFNYTFSQDSVAIGLADGHPSRKYNMLVACLLLFMDYHPDNLSAIARTCPEPYYVMALQYMGMQRLGTPYTELPVEKIFPGVTILSNLLPAVLDDPDLPWEQEDRPRPMSSAKSRGHKAVLEARSKAQPHNPLSWQKSKVTEEPNGPLPPTPPPPPKRDSPGAQNKGINAISNKPKNPGVPPPPKPSHARASGPYQCKSKVASHTTTSNMHTSWGRKRQDTWQPYSYSWKKR